MTRPGYKMTEIGEIPDGWEVTKLKDISLISAGNTAPQLEKYFEDGKYPFIRVKHLNELEAQKYPIHYDLVNDLAVSELKLKKFPKGAIIFPKSGESIKMEKRAMLKDESFVVNHLAIIEPTSQKISNLFLFYYLTTIKTRRYLTQTTMPSLNISMIQSLIIPLPPLSEQKKIAEILSAADETIQKVNEETMLTEKLKKGLMQTLITKGIGHTKFKMTEIGEIPEEWEISKLDKIFNIFTGTTPSTKIRKYWHNGSIEWLTPKDLGRMADSIFISSSEKKITPDALKECSLNLIPKGSILISTRAPVGYVGVSKTKITFNQGCKGLVPIELNNTDISFYAYYLVYKRSILVSNSSGSTFKELSKESLANFDVPVPPLPEQLKIAEILTTVDHKLELLRTKKTHLEKLKKGLMEDLLTGRVRVKVPKEGHK